MSKWRTRVTLATIAGGIALALAGTAAAEDSERIKAMKAMGGHLGAISKVAKGEMAYSPEVVTHAEAIQDSSTKVLSWFPEGSGGDNTRAKPEIWSNWSDFEAAVKRLQEAAPALVAAAKTGDQAQIGTALGAVGKACGGCHDTFRKPKS